MKEASGRYFFNADEVITVSFNNDILYLNWRGSDLKPLKVNDSTFYVAEMNEKLIFNTFKKNIILAEKREHKGRTYTFDKLEINEKTPSEYLENGDFTRALKGFLKIQKKDSLNPVIRERTLNSIGYQFLKINEMEKAIGIFTINTKLYPNSSNTFDSLGDSYLKQKDTVLAMENYEKSLAINPENKSSRRQLNKLKK